MNIHLTIERLVLDGLPIALQQGALVKAALEAELAQLLSDGGLAPAWQSGGAVPSMCAGAIQLTADSNPTSVGRQIARSIYGGLQQ